SELDFVPIDGARATASLGTGAEFAVDDDASTRWSSEAAQAPGQYVQVDLGAREHFRRVAVDSGGNLGDYARGWRLAVSDDGVRWRTVAEGVGDGQLTTVDLPRTRARHLRITATAQAGNWWNVSDVRLYG
ncbi:discoidin domain-containing protein, partial [Umezawaea sp.]|uniref:discoidin domain-containing protein n=1 Tax=Umezawaea sp. TaxID=1955258 RepID=UPI002ED19B60